MFTYTATIIASLLPVVAILILFVLKETLTRIYVTIRLTAGLGVILKLFTNANMKEVFGVTTASVAGPLQYGKSLTDNQIRRRRGSLHWQCERQVKRVLQQRLPKKFAAIRDAASPKDNDRNDGRKKRRKPESFESDWRPLRRKKDHCERNR